MISSILSEQYTAELQVMDPNNDEIVNEQVDLEGDEFFEFAFDLANDGSLGRYAVIASYANGDQLGFALFEVKD